MQCSSICINVTWSAGDCVWVLSYSKHLSFPQVSGSQRPCGFWLHCPGSQLDLSLPACFTDEEHNCLWRDCGFCSVEGDAELLRHVFFHCYHAKLKQWGLAILNSHSDMGACSVGLHNRNIVPEVQENFLCLWEHCEVWRQSNIFFLSTVDDKLHVASQIRSSTQLISMFVFRCLWIIQSGSTDMWRCMHTVSRLMKRMFCSVAGKVRNDCSFFLI